MWQAKDQAYVASWLWDMAVGSFTSCCSYVYSTQGASRTALHTSQRQTINQQPDELKRCAPMGKEAQVARAGLSITAHSGAVPAGV
jgi:hypothetical protein